MQTINYPKRESWSKILARPAMAEEDLTPIVSKILDDVILNGDNALRLYGKKFEGVWLEEFEVTTDEIAEAESAVSDELKRAVAQAKSNIEKFHRSQVEEIKEVETTEGVFCWRKSVAIEKVGLYVPAGTAPLFSTVLMLAIPAKIAGCKEIILCSPPDAKGKINPVTLYASRLCGVTKVFKLGGAQAIGALAYGTETVPKVYKIFGPGNQFVTAAKQFVSRTGTAIDMPAGPSEVAVLADETCVPAFVAADLLSQAEHGADSQVVLVSTNENVINETLNEVVTQLAELPRREIAAKALENSKAILVKKLDEAIEILNEYASEHLILATKNADEIAAKITNAGSVFLGNYSCEAAGDYASGTNHALPTNGYAKAFSGVSLDSFVKKITFQRLTERGVLNLGETIELMAEAEHLHAHKNAISLRIKSLR